MSSNQSLRKVAVFFIVTSGFILAGCGGSSQFKDMSSTSGSLSPIDAVQDDGSVVHGRALVTVSSEQETSLAKVFGFIFPSAYASNGSVLLSYTNSANTLFTLNNSLFTPGSFSGTTLSLGNISVATLSDNNLQVCGTNSNTKCTGAVIRVYTTGSITGFVNTAGGYGAPVYTGTLNPTTALGLTSTGSVQVQSIGTISSSKHTVTIADFPSPSYAVSADFSNAGAGSYSMTYVLEYALLP